MFTLQRRFVFPGFHRIIELKTSKHEFSDIIHQNKQGFDGKKLSEGQAGSNTGPCHGFRRHLDEEAKRVRNYSVCMRI